MTNIIGNAIDSNSVTDTAIEKAIEDVYGKTLLKSIDKEHIEYAFLGRIVWQEDDGSFRLVERDGLGSSMPYDVLVCGLKSRDLVLTTTGFMIVI